MYKCYNGKPFLPAEIILVTYVYLIAVINNIELCVFCVIHKYQSLRVTSPERRETNILMLELLKVSLNSRRVNFTIRFDLMLLIGNTITLVKLRIGKLRICNQYYSET